MPEYYDGAKLLSLRDLDGNVPEIFICTANRTAGKTTYFAKMMVNRFLKRGEKFILIYRFNYELDNCAEKFFKDIGSLFFPEWTMTSIKCAKGIYHKLSLVYGDQEEGRECGYAIALNNADQIKKMSHLFSDAASMMFDEFQSETNHYCADEVSKLISVHTSVARGQGKMVRYVPIYMIGNPVTILNPYYTALGITDRLNEKTRFLRGHGYVMEQGFNEAAANAITGSGFNRAFSEDKYIAYSAQGVYLNDVKTFIERPEGRSKYLTTLKCDGREYAVRSFPDEGIIYCDDRPDQSYPSKISVTTEDHNINYVMLRANDLFIQQLRYFFDRGCFRFKDLRCKNAILKALSY